MILVVLQQWLLRCIESVTYIVASLWLVGKSVTFVVSSLWLVDMSEMQMRKQCSGPKGGKNSFLKT